LLRKRTIIVASSSSSSFQVRWQAVGSSAFAIPLALPLAIQFWRPLSRCIMQIQETNWTEASEALLQARISKSCQCHFELSEVLDP
jgi:hypothetical protein